MAIVLLAPYSLIAAGAYMLTGEGTMTQVELANTAQLSTVREIGDSEGGFSGNSNGIILLHNEKDRELKYSDAGSPLEFKLNMKD